jgi:hypothetical protein
MLRKSIIFLFLLPLLIATIYSQADPGKDTLINYSITARTTNGDMPAENVNFNNAKDWANNLSLTLIPDSPPVIDNSAFFLTNFQTVIPVTGYKKELMYKVFIDFLKYREAKVPFNSILKIYIRDINGNRKLVGIADLSYMTSKKIFEVPVPFDLSYPGRFDIIIQEYSGRTGCWGIWDIIVTSKKINEIELIPIDSTEKMKQSEEKIFK